MKISDDVLVATLRYCSEPGLECGEKCPGYELCVNLEISFIPEKIAADRIEELKRMLHEKGAVE